MPSDNTSKTSSDNYLSMNENDPLLLPEAGHEIESKRAVSPWHVIIPLFFITFGMGALLAPLVQFYTEIFCDRYYQTDEETDGGLLTWMMGDIDRPDSPSIYTQDCTIPEIQAIVSRVQTILLFLDSASSLFMAGYYGSLSDRHGRRLVLRISAIGGIVVMLCYIAVANFRHIFGVTLLIVAPLARGLLAGDVIVSAVIQSYISDCTTPEVRTIAMGRMMGVILAAVVFGPTVASMIILKSGTVAHIFYLVLAIYIIFYLYATYYLPESLSQQAMEAAQQKSTQERKQSIWQKINLFSALSILVKASPKNVSSYAIPLLAAIQFLLATISQPPVLLYAMLQFKWTAYEGGFLASSMALARFIAIIWILPYLLRTMQARWQSNRTDVDDGDDTNGDKDYYRVLFDIIMIRSGFAIDTVCITLGALATTGSQFTLCMIFQSMAVITYPALISLYTTLADPSEVGALCGAQAVIGSLATLTTVTGINFIYSVSVRTMPSLFLYVCAGVTGLGCLLACMIHPIKRQNEHSTP